MILRFLRAKRKRTTAVAADALERAGRFIKDLLGYLRSFDSANKALKERLIGVSNRFILQTCKYIKGSYRHPRMLTG